MHRSPPCDRRVTALPAPRAQDGTIQHETKLTGCLSTNVLSEGEGPLPEHGTLLAPGLNAQHHQHFFCARLDPAVDDPAGGAALTVVEVRPRSKRVHPPQALPCGRRPPCSSLDYILDVDMRWPCM